MARDEATKGGGDQLVCRNPKATQRFDIEERLEAGIVLLGSEVKSLRQRRADLDGAYASIDGTELWLHGMHIAPYEQAGPHLQHEPKRSRKLLVHRHQIERLYGKLAIRGFTLVPTRVYFKQGRAKVELGLGKGKRVVDRRQDIKRKQDIKEAREAVRRGKQR
ncbi:MAG: SsrA-binding protein SmpB [Myxococcota bacterium]